MIELNSVFFVHDVVRKTFFPSAHLYSQEDGKNSKFNKEGFVQTKA